MEQENIRKETFLATLLLLAGTLILWKGYSYEPDSRQFPVFLGWLFVSFSILNAITLFKKFKAEKLSLSFEFHRPGFPSLLDNSAVNWNLRSRSPAARLLSLHIPILNTGDGRIWLHP